jgi:hypothetical protein
MRALAFIIPLVLLSSPVRSETIPTYDIEAICRAARSLSPDDKDPYATCMKDEQSAHAELRQKWSSYRASDQRSCSEQSRLVSPSYVALLVCVQMFTTTDTPRPARER